MRDIDIMRCVSVFFGVLVVFVGVLGGCSDERTAWRDGATDVAGRWRLTSPALADAAVEFKNEADVNDIMAMVTRTSASDAVTEAELDVLARLRDDNERVQARTELALGVGADAFLAEVVGGENVSFDGGATTSIDVISRAFAADSGAAFDSSVRWGMSLRGDDEQLRGTLFVTERQRSPTLGSTDVDRSTQRSEIAVVLVRE
jgi:hypothetical protein